MRITIQATIENADDSSPPQVIQVGEVTRDADVDPASGLGLTTSLASPSTLCSLRLLERIGGERSRRPS